MSGKLFYSVNVIIASLRKKPLITHHNTIKNLIIQWNDEIKNSPLSRQIQIKIGPLSSIEKENKFRYKDRIPREKWENEDRDYLLENTEGDFIFEYQAFYELEFYREIEKPYREKDLIYNRGPGFEVYYFYNDFLDKITPDLGHKTITDLWGDSDFTGVRIINYPEYPAETLREWKENNMKQWKFAKDLGYDLDIQKAVIQSERLYPKVKEYLGFKERENIKLTKSDVAEFNKIETEIKEKNIAWIEEYRKKARDSWK